MNIKEFIKQVIAETPELSNIDLSEGTNLYDLLIVPLEVIINDRLKKTIIEGAGEKLDLGNYASMTIDELKVLARNHLVSVHEKNKTKGYITLYFKEPVEITIPQGTRLLSGKSEFHVTEDYMISGDFFTDPENAGKCSLLIEVENDEGAHIAQNTLGYVNSPPAGLIRIEHPAMLSGTQDYTNRELYEKVKASIGGTHAMSPAGIKNLLSNRIGTIRRVTVIGANDKEMLRDKIYNFASGSSYYNKYSGFEGKIAGRSSDSDFNKNTAHSVFISSFGDNEYFGSDGKEFTQQQYEAIASEDDSITAKISTGNIFSDKFTQSSAVVGNTAVVSKATDNDDDANNTYTVLTVSSANGFAAGDIVNIKISQNNTGYPTRTGVIRSITNSTTIELYGKIVHPTGTLDSTSIIEVVTSEGLFIGNGWVASEDGMVIGTKINPREAMVIDDELVLGSTSSDFSGNIVLETVLRNGVDKFMKAIEGALSRDVSVNHSDNEQQER